MKVAVVSGPRAEQRMGLELAEARLLDALRTAPSDVDLDVRVVGGRGGFSHARRIGARWIPGRPGVVPPLAWRGADLVHLLGLDLAPPRRKPFVAMVHDLSPLRYPDEPPMSPWARDIIRHARLLLTPSEFTAGELQELLDVQPERIRVVGSGPAFDARSAELLSQSELERLGIDSPFVLRYGGYTARKNLPLLLDTWTRVPEATLVLVGPPQPARSRILANAPTLDRVVVLDYVPQSLLMRLLRTASALVSTSSYEGFGLPPLEALVAGTPVVAVRTRFTEEVCGDAAVLVDADSDAVAGGLDTVLNRPRVLSSPEHLKAFTWARAAEEVLRSYRAAT
jgi:glycosyltransferase involved in cell wall biosynthesis